MAEELPEWMLRTKEGIHVLKDDSHLSRWIEENGRLDVAEGEIGAWSKYIPMGGFVVDAGASLGDHTATYAKRVGPAGMVYAFEPHPQTCEALRRNFEGQRNVTVINRALSDMAGQRMLNCEPNIGASWVGRAGDNPVPVFCVTLDQYISPPRLDFIHLDCEGFEIKAIDGGAALIRKFRPVIVLEVNHECLERNNRREQDVLNRIAELGYQWRETQSDYGPHLPQRDLICTPK